VGGKAPFNVDRLKTDAAKLRFNMSEPDVKTRIKKLQMDHKALLICRNCPKFIETSPKFAVQHILAAFTSPTIQDKVVNDLEYEEADLKKDYTGFIKHLIKQAIAYETCFSLSIVSKGSSGGGGAHNGGSGGFGGSGSSRNGGGGDTGGGSGVESGARAGSSGGSGSFGGSNGSNGLGGSGRSGSSGGRNSPAMNPTPASGDQATKLKSKSRNPNHRCFGCQKPTCNINHCPDVTDEARARIIAEKFSPAANTRCCPRPLGQQTPPIAQTTNSRLVFLARLDSGADDTFVPRTFI
jgi:hypothetical protein